MNKLAVILLEDKIEELKEKVISGFLSDYEVLGNDKVIKELQSAIDILSSNDKVIFDIHGTVHIDHIYEQVVIKRDKKKWFPSELIKDSLGKKVKLTITEVKK